MALSSDILLERLHLKRRLSFWRLACVAVLTMVLVLWLDRDNIPSVSGEYIAKISINGIVTDDSKILGLIHAIEKNEDARALLVELDTPGGTVVGGEALYKALLKVKKKKPVISVMRGTAASAGYMIAVAGERIYAMEGTLTGSIGVLMQTAEFTQMAEKLGINPITVKSGYYKASPSPIEKLEAKQRAALQDVVLDFYDSFVKIVMKERKMKRTEVLKVADGRVFTGRQALKLNLVDAIGDEAEAVAWLKKQHRLDSSLNIRKLKPEKQRASLFERMAESMIGKNYFSERLRLDGLLAIWQPT